MATRKNSDKEIVRVWDKPCDEPFRYIEKVKNKKER
jgi:hypothetical protein